MLSPSLRYYSGFGKCIKGFSVEQLVSKLPVERFNVTILPRTTVFDIECLDPKPLQPSTDEIGRKLGAIGRIEVVRNSF